MAARFEKDGKILDGFDPNSPYQMVPKGGERPMSVVTQMNACALAVADSSLVMIKDSTSPNPFAYKEIPANSRFDFSIVSQGKPGKTRLELTELQSRVGVGVLFVSVKATLPQDFALLLLSDTQNATIRPVAEADFLMHIAAEAYAEQANVKLTQVGIATAVSVPRPLGNPLLPDKQMGFPSTNTVLDEVLAATPGAFMASSLIRVYCCWDVGSIHNDPKKALGETGGKSCFVEDGANEFTFGHELGHALGLDHNTRPKRLMDEFLQVPPTFRLDQFEIDKINSSGT